MLPPDALSRLADLLDEELVAIAEGDHVAVDRICDERERLLPIAAGATRADADLAAIVVERSRRNERAASARAGELYAELRRLERGRTAIAAYGSVGGQAPGGTIMERAG